MCVCVCVCVCLCVCACVLVWSLSYKLTRRNPCCIAHLSRLVSQTRHQPGARGMQPAARNAEIAKGGHEVTIACIRKQRLAGPAPAGGWKLNCDVAKSLLHRRCPKNCSISWKLEMNLFGFGLQTLWKPVLDQKGPTQPRHHSWQATNNESKTIESNVVRRGPHKTAAKQSIQKQGKYDKTFWFSWIRHQGTLTQLLH